MNLVDEALCYFADGFNCAQSILTAYSEQFGIDQQTALKVSCGFGAGCGRSGLTCGAVSGAFMVIGMKYGKVRADDNAAKEKTYALVQEYSHQFRLRNKSLTCAELLGCDLSTKEGTEKFKRDNLLETVCEKVVKDSAEILEGLL